MYMQIHERKLNRSRNFDYSLDGCYFVTTCVKNFIHVFGKIQNNQMILNKYGEIVKQQLLWLPNQYPYIRLNEWCIMPNHAHAIIVIDRHNMATDRAVGVIVGTPSHATTLSLSHIVGIDRHNTGTNNAYGVDVGTGRDLSLRVPHDHTPPMPTTKIKSLSEIVGAFKTTSSKLIHQSGLEQFVWQRSFHDRVIRDSEGLKAIGFYIQNNPANWCKDRNN